MAEDNRRRRKLAAILMADVSGFSRMMGEDEESTVSLIQEFHARVKQRVERHDGRVVDTAGDSVFGEFDSVVNAMEAAHEIQAEQAALNHRRPGGPVETRIGLHLGDVIVEGERVYGDGVNIAARLETAAEPGGICLSDAVYQQVHNKVDLPFRDLGERSLKNIEAPVRLYTVDAKAVVPIEPAPLPGPAPAPARTGRGRRRRPERHTRRKRPERGSRRRAEPRTWSEELTRVWILTLLLGSAVLVAAPALGLPTGGIFELAGTAGLATTLARTATRVHRRNGLVLFALGAAIATGALWTQWSPLTDRLFIAAGLVTATCGLPGFVRSGWKRAR